MADFDLSQTDQQVQNILNDAQGAMGAGAQTTLTTEYVMLKDTNGVYHKILKSSFTEAIRDVLAGLLVNNDKGTTINQIAAIASGDFGSITPANLASVLGGAYMLMPLFYKGTLTNDAYADLNDVRKTCIVQAKDNTLNKPVSGATYYNVLTIRGSHFMSQIAFDVMSNNCYTRSVYIHQGVDEWPWPSWVKITTTAIQ